MSNFVLALTGAALIFLILGWLIYRKQEQLQASFLRFEGQVQHLPQQLEHQVQANSEIVHYCRQFLQQQQTWEQQFQQSREHDAARSNTLQQALLSSQFEHFKRLQESLQKTAQELREQVTATLRHDAQSIEQRMDKLTEKTEQQLGKISEQVEKRLLDGFEKTTATFNDVVKRLAMIDAAQQKITELSSNVVNLQEILSDKRSRGAFGEVQLLALIRNMLPEASFAVQATLSNGKRVDCLLLLPEPTGNVAIDAKFPLENYRLTTNMNSPESERKSAEQQFRQDIRKHIDDIASKYILPGETSDGAMMFIPAEAIFAEIHARYPDLVDFAQRSRVWMVSPTTFMAVLTTARAVLKDAATRKQVHIIQEHLHHLAKDFSRFEKRMENLARHIHQAHTDVQEVNTSAKKISQRFGQIEQVDLQEVPDAQENLLEKTDA